MLSLCHTHKVFEELTFLKGNSPRGGAFFFFDISSSEILAIHALSPIVGQLHDSYTRASHQTIQIIYSVNEVECLTRCANRLSRVLGSNFTALVQAVVLTNTAYFRLVHLCFRSPHCDK